MERAVFPSGLLFASPVPKEAQAKRTGKKRAGQSGLWPFKSELALLVLEARGGGTYPF